MEDKLPHWMDLEQPCDQGGKFRPVRTFEQLHNYDLDTDKNFQLPTPSGNGHWQINPISKSKSDFGFHSFVSMDRQQYVTSRSDQVRSHLILLFAYSPPLYVFVSTGVTIAVSHF